MKEMRNGVLIYDEILILVPCSLKMTCVTYSTNANGPQRSVEIRSEGDTDINTAVDKGTA